MYNSQIFQYSVPFYTIFMYKMEGWNCLYGTILEPTGSSWLKNLRSLKRWPSTTTSFSVKYRGPTVDPKRKNMVRVVTSSGDPRYLRTYTCGHQEISDGGTGHLSMGPWRGRNLTRMVTTLRGNYRVWVSFLFQPPTQSGKT